MAALLVAAMMSKDEEQALTLVKSGADPNLRDQYGVPMLNWATMMCMPRLVKTLVDRGADLKYERAPGFTILQEAGACPEAAKILRAAGAK
jgi:ankyrin repeat protein